MHTKLTGSVTKYNDASYWLFLFELLSELIARTSIFFSTSHLVTNFSNHSSLFECFLGTPLIKQKNKPTIMKWTYQHLNSAISKLIVDYCRPYNIITSHSWFCKVIVRTSKIIFFHGAVNKSLYLILLPFGPVTIY